MTIRGIIQISAIELAERKGILHQPAQTVVKYDEALQELVADLDDTLRASPIAVGLAAPQIGHSCRVVVINISKGKTEKSLTLINPVIVEETGKKDKKYESCMSLPGLKGEVIRRENIVVRYADLTGQVVTLNAKGFLARVISHEVDHLTGSLYPERLLSGKHLEQTDIFERQ